MGLFDSITTETWNLATKAGFSLSLFLLTLVFALLPLVVVKSYHTEQDPDKKTWYSRVIGLLNCFAGGVFLGTALLHLLPQVVDMLSPVREQTKFPLAEFTVALGFLVVMVVEQTTVACREQQVDTLNPVQRLCQPPLPIVIDHSDIHTLGTDEISQSMSPCLNLPAPVEAKPMSLLRSVLLLTVLSIHSVFEGLAIGLQADMHSVVAIFVAVIVHKVIVAFSIGLSLLQSRLPLTSVFALDVLFSIMSPVGLLFGLLIDKFQGSRQQLFSGILQGISCGTFLYITCFEVLPRELNQGRDRLLKLMLLLIGFSTSVAAIFMETR